MLNKVLLVGRLGNDPEVRYFENDSAVANFSIATTEVRKDKEGNRVETTEWHRIVAWRSLAKIVEQYVKKGSLVLIEGKIRSRSWDDRDGNKRYTTEIVADNLKMLDRRDSANGDDNGSVSAQPQVEEGVPAAVDGSDDLPF